MVWLVTWRTDDGVDINTGWDEFDSHDEAEDSIDWFKAGCEGSSTHLAWSYTLWKAEEVRNG